MKVPEMCLFGPQTRFKPNKHNKHVEILRVEMKKLFLSAFLHTVFSARIIAAHFQTLTCPAGKKSIASFWIWRTWTPQSPAY